MSNPRSPKRRRTQTFSDNLLDSSSTQSATQLVSQKYVAWHPEPGFVSNFDTLPSNVVVNSVNNERRYNIPAPPAAVSGNTVYSLGTWMEGAVSIGTPISYKSTEWFTRATLVPRTTAQHDSLLDQNRVPTFNIKFSGTTLVSQGSIGSGGFGRVFKFASTTPYAQCAVKILHSDTAAAGSVVQINSRASMVSKLCDIARTESFRGGEVQIIELGLGHAAACAIDREAGIEEYAVYCITTCICMLKDAYLLAPDYKLFNTMYGVNDSGMLEFRMIDVDGLLDVRDAFTTICGAPTTFSDLPKVMFVDHKSRQTTTHCMLDRNHRSYLQRPSIAVLQTWYAAVYSILNYANLYNNGRHIKPAKIDHNGPWEDGHPLILCMATLNNIPNWITKNISDFFNILQQHKEQLNPGTPNLSTLQQTVTLNFPYMDQNKKQGLDTKTNRDNWFKAFNTEQAKAILARQLTLSALEGMLLCARQAQGQRQH